MLVDDAVMLPPVSLTTLVTAGNSFAGNTFDIVPNADLTITGINSTTGVVNGDDLDTISADDLTRFQAPEAVVEADAVKW